MTTSVLIVDDDRAVRVLIRAYLDAEDAFDVVGEAGTAAEALEVAAEVMPDLVTMDYQMPGRNGAEGIRDMKARWPGIAVLGFTSSSAEEIRSMVAAGAYAAIDKAHLDLVIPALYQVADQRERDRRAGLDIGPLGPEAASQWEELRDVIAEMDAGAARTLEEHKQKLAERLELIVVLKAVLAALRSAKYSTEQANEVAVKLLRAVLETDADEDA